MLMYSISSIVSVKSFSVYFI